MPAQDYLCAVHNNFDRIMKAYPNRVVNGNTERELLSPRFMAEHCSFVEYEDVDEGNENLAELVGRYGYSQSQFDHIQEVYEMAKKIKDSYVIMADKSNEKDLITFRVLEKDDPLGFVLGNITNCCQSIGDVGESCVEDGYKNLNAGFLVFEESSAGETRVLGQAYIWYDPETKTVCYDNIEIPTAVLDELRAGEKQGKGLSSSRLMKAVEKSAVAIMRAMNKDKLQVERVTTGQGYNDLRRELDKNFKLETRPIAKHRNYSGYTDARLGQYIIKTYDEVTKMYSDVIEKTASEIAEDLQNIQDANDYKYEM
jgi:hypothetical protein